MTPREWVLKLNTREIEAVCAGCFQPCLISLKSVRRGPPNYCSFRCIRIHTKASWTGSGNPNWKGGVETRTCTYCGKLFQCWRYRKKHLYCSMDCAAKHKRRNYGDVELRNRVHFENDLCAYLEARGYSCVRSAGSRGPADLFAFNYNHLRIIQVKTTVSLERKGNISVFASAIELLRDMPCPPNATQELWVKPLRKNWIYLVVSDMEAQTREEIRRYLKSPQWIEG